MHSHSRTKFVFWKATVNSGIHWALHIVRIVPLWLFVFLLWDWFKLLTFIQNQTVLQPFKNLKTKFYFFANDVITQYWSVKDPENTKQSV